MQSLISWVAKQKNSKFSAIHPGEFLREMLDVLSMTQAAYDLKLAQIEIKDDLKQVRLLAGS